MNIFSVVEVSTFDEMNKKVFTRSSFVIGNNITNFHYVYKGNFGRFTEIFFIGGKSIIVKEDINQIWALIINQCDLSVEKC